jgi:type IV pilus assembly protein PilB
MDTKKKLGDLLVEAGLIDEIQLRAALAHQKQWGGRIGAILISMGFITEEKLLKFLSSHLQMPAVDFKKVKIQDEVLKLISMDIAKKHHVLPIAIWQEGNKKYLLVAMSDPTNLAAIDEIQFITNLHVKPAIATDTAIGEGIRYYYEGIGLPPGEEGREGVPLSEPVDERMIVYRDREDTITSEDISAHPKAGAEKEKKPAEQKDAWALSFTLAQMLVEKGLIDKDELLRRLKEKKK